MGLFGRSAPATVTVPPNMARRPMPAFRWCLNAGIMRDTSIRTTDAESSDFFMVFSCWFSPNVFPTIHGSVLRMPHSRSLSPSSSEQSVESAIVHLARRSRNVRDEPNRVRFGRQGRATLYAGGGPHPRYRKRGRIAEPISVRHRTGNIMIGIRLLTLNYFLSNLANSLLLLEHLNSLIWFGCLYRVPMAITPPSTPEQAELLNCPPVCTKVTRSPLGSEPNDLQIPASEFQSSPKTSDCWEYESVRRGVAPATQHATTVLG